MSVFIRFFIHKNLFWKEKRDKKVKHVLEMPCSTKAKSNVTSNVHVRLLGYLEYIGYTALLTQVFMHYVQRKSISPKQRSK